MICNVYRCVYIYIYICIYTHIHTYQRAVRRRDVGAHGEREAGAQRVGEADDDGENCGCIM